MFTRWMPEEFKERLRRRAAAVTMSALLEKLQQAGFAPYQIIDSGAGGMFGQIEVIQTEVSVLRIGGVPLIDEVWSLFRTRGYRPYDVFGQNYRPLDGALWQCDLVVVREDSPLITSRQWA